MPEEHALLSASAAKRWMSCPASARIEELLRGQFGDGENKYSQEGTTAHALAARSFVEDISKIVFPNEEMKECVIAYHDYVMQIYQDCLAKDQFTSKFHEVKLNYSKYIPDGFGTGDTVIISLGKIIIIDFKYGAGVEVSAVENHQMKLYGLGGIDTYDFMYDITDVELHIFQPRMSNISSWGITRPQLEEWGNSIKEVGIKAFTGDAECNPGEHCQFCLARGLCRARANYVLDLQKDQKDFQVLNLEEIAPIYEKALQAESYIKQLKAWCLEKMMSGVKIPGLKLKAPRLTSAYSDQEAVEQYLRSKGYADAVIHKPRELITLTELKKLLKTAGYREFEAAGLVVKTEGNVSVVLASDPAPEYEPKEAILAEFEPVNNNAEGGK